MVNRSTALCDGKIEYIEELYKVIDGKQINDPEKLDYFRKKSQNKELFCPCGCGVHLQLVAGIRMTKAQHFRVYPNENTDNCLYRNKEFESKESIYSRISIKCWMEDKYGTEDIDLRTKLLDSIAELYDDLPYSSISKKIAVKYIDKNINLKRKEIDSLLNNCKGYKTVFIVGPNNYPREGQYPEGLKHIQDIQGFILVLSSNEGMYESSELRACYYEKNRQGLWDLIELANEPLSSYHIDADGKMYVLGISLTKLCEEKRKEFLEKQKPKKNTPSLPDDDSDSESSKPFVFNMSMEDIREKYLRNEQINHENERRKDKS